MKRPDETLVLDEALRKLRAGVPLDQVLAECGDFAAELAPLLEAAQWMQSSVPPAAPRGAVARSRARFLQAAEARSARALPFFARFRWAVNLAVILAVLAAALFFTGLGSVSALPGQALYPVKRAVEQARLALASSDPAGKLLLEENFDRRRVEEALRLAELGRGQRVSFAGFLSGGNGQPWTVEGLTLQLDGALQATAQSLPGAYVEVQGQVQADGTVLVSVLRLRFFELKGQLAQNDGERWLISGVWVAITGQTQVEQPPAVGQRVEITAIRLSQQDFLALTVRLQDGSPSSPAVIATADDDDDLDETPEPRATDDGDDGEDDSIDKTDQPGGDDDGSDDTDDDSGSGGGDNETPDSGDDGDNSSTPDDDSGGDDDGDDDDNVTPDAGGDDDDVSETPDAGGDD
jgi:hypothetical protein